MLPMTFMNPFLRLAGLSMFLIFGPAHALDADLNAQADALLNKYFEPEGPGAAVAVIVDGEVLVQTSIGLADIDEGVPINANSVFDLASVSKHFTAAAALKLAGDGLLDVRQPVSRYVPDYVDQSPTRPVSVADLVYHLSGIADYTSDSWDGTDQEFAQLTTNDHLLWQNEHEPDRAPGILFSYNNSGYALLSLVVERVSGQSFAAFAQARLFRTAGMRSARAVDRLGLRLPKQVVGYKGDGDEGFEESSAPSSITGDGNVFASLADMIAWLRALDGTLIFTPAQKRIAWTNGRLDSGRAIASDGSGYGYGWSIEPDNVVSHSGSWFGASTYVLRHLTDGVSVIVLSNDEDAEASEIAEALAELVE